jgi:hypothetical protein
MSRGAGRRGARSAARYTPGPHIGAIRWDAWFGPSDLSDAGTEVEVSMGPNTWRSRLPFFGTEIDSDEVTVRGNSQATVDQEIVYARQAGLAYWAFVSYQPATYTGSDYLTYGLHYYRQSANKRGLKYCLILQQLGSAAGWPTLCATYASLAAESDFFKVLAGRPLFYFLSSATIGGVAITAADITTFRNAFTAAGVANPYLVAMSVVPSTAATNATALGMDAIGGYTWAESNGGTGLDGRNAAALATRLAAQRVLALATGKKVVPCVNEGWDKRPRFDNPPSWEPGLLPDIYYARPTATEFANNVRDTVDWVRLNRSTCEADTILVYAWNEIDEGGWMTPPLAPHGSEGTTRLDAVKTMLLDRRVVA